MKPPFPFARDWQTMPGRLALLILPLLTAHAENPAPGSAATVPTSAAGQPPLPPQEWLQVLTPDDQKKQLDALSVAIKQAVTQAQEKQVKLAKSAAYRAGSAVIRLYVEPDGSIPSGNVVLLQSSGSEALDDSFLASARTIERLPVKPPGNQLVGVTIQMTSQGTPPTDLPSNLALAGPYREYYLKIYRNVFDKWKIQDFKAEPGSAAVVTIHVDAQGNVQPEQVKLTRSSGNKLLDASALEAARTLDPLPPLPRGCPSDIPITFNPPHYQ